MLEPAQDHTGAGAIVLLSEASATLAFQEWVTCSSCHAVVSIGRVCRRQLPGPDAHRQDQPGAVASCS